ncbi:hypothetical protein F7725_027844 [Dissostichus mawsoni]|uniref:Uncharacterized protein n=1 Tax=Dissostichus mawsoni TaxID=36200 RepID=A0A7J5XE16_DISMA|nr:hypothetical protein F7725_027844 [Dissostichus mawsoni]
MGEDFLFQLGHLVPQQAGCGGQVDVVVFQRFDLVLQPGDPLQFAHPTLGGCNPVPEPLPLGFHDVLWIRDSSCGAAPKWCTGGGGKGTVSVRLHEALCELLLFRHRLRVEEMGAGRYGGDHPVGLDDEPLQLRGGQLEQPQVRGAEDALGVTEMRFEVCLDHQAQPKTLTEKNWQEEGSDLELMLGRIWRNKEEVLVMTEEGQRSSDICWTVGESQCQKRKDR